MQVRSSSTHDISLILAWAFTKLDSLLVTAKLGTLSLFHALEKQNLTRPSAPSLFYAPSHYQETWSETYTKVLRFAAFFKTKAVMPGDVVVVDYTNKPAILHIYMALNSIGAAPAFLNYNLSGEPLLHCLKVSRSKLLVVDEDLANKVLPIRKAIVELGLEVVVLDHQQLREVNALPLRRPDYDARRNRGTDTSCIYYTRSAFSVTCCRTIHAILAGPRVSLSLQFSPSLDGTVPEC